MGSKCFELRNLYSAPAREDALVGASLAFANGCEVVIRGQPSCHEVRSWSLWQQAPTAEERADHVKFLHSLITGGEEGYPLPWPVSGNVNGEKDPRARYGVFTVMGIGPLNETAAQSLVRPRHFQQYVSHMQASLERELVFIGRRRGYALCEFRHFKNVAAAVALGVTLLLDDSKPYLRALCRCKLPSCGAFYLARKNPRGGPPNRTYCDPTHREQHHNSYERVAAVRKRQARHK